MRISIKEIVIIFVCAFLLQSGCAGSNHGTIANIESHWGRSVRIVPLPDGSEKRFYPFRAEGDTKYVYFVFKNGTAVDQGISPP